MISPQLVNLSGQRFGHWLVGEYAGNSYWLCACDCGAIKSVGARHLKTGATQSCGCSWTTHGLSRSNEYRVWDSMVRRCHSPAHRAYRLYGARGIRVCERWRTFENFYQDMGPRPSDDLSIDRINNDGNYEPSNCRWATRAEQARNRSTTKLNSTKSATARELLVQGVTQAGVAAVFGCSRSAIGHLVLGKTWKEI